MDLNTTQMTLTEAENATYWRLYEAKQGILGTYIWIIIVLGFPGNVACVLTVLSMSSLSTATLYVAMLAVVDCMTLAGKLIVHQLTFHQVYLGDGGCKATSLVNILNCYANWMLVLVCFERFLAVRWPLKKAIFFTKNRALLIAGLLFGVIFVAYSHMFFLFKSNGAGLKCGYSKSVGMYVYVWYWFSAILFTLAPFILLVVFTTFIVTGLRKYREARKSILGGGDTVHNGKGERRVDGTNVERAISVMMSVAAAVFLLLTIPSCIFIVSYDYWSIYHPVTKVRWLLFQQVTFVLADLNHAINFYLYFLTADKFRTQFKNLILCRRPHIRKKSDMTSVGEHTQYTRANSSENLAMNRM